MTRYILFFTQVLVPKDENLLGKLVEVEITETGKHFMKCRLLGDAVRPRDVPPPLQKGQISGLKKVSAFVNIHQYLSHEPYGFY